MTDSKALIERLRYTEEHGIFTAHEAGLAAMPGEAADHIEKLEADNARLREKLEQTINQLCGDCHTTITRAALQETSHD